MKQISLLLLGFFVVLSVSAQQNLSVLKIDVNGNKNLQIAVDGKEYNLTNSIGSGNKTSISINNLETGPHTFLATRTNANVNRPDRTSATFNLRYGYDMLLKVNGNGSLELIETKKAGMADNQTPVSDAVFNTLIKNVKAQRSTNGRRILISNAFNKTNNYFTTSQVVKLLQLVNSESFRLQLAKLSYHTITDKYNFDQVYELLNSQASENDLEDYVNDYYEDSDADIAMNEASFNSLYQSIRQQWPVSTQVNSLTSAFASSNNHFTTYQARQLIQIVAAESNRLQLAKASYRSITDPANFSQMNNLFSNQSSINELTAYVNNYYSGGNSGVAMSDVNFNSLHHTIQQQWPVSTQVNSLTSAFASSNNQFTTYQARHLIQIVAAESSRLQLAKASYRSITDPANFSQMNSLFSSQASINELTVYVNNYNSGNNTILPMKEADFNSLHHSIQQQWPVSTQVNSLTSAFASSNNHFTTYQAKQLIQIVSAESSRLQLAKASYRSITDPVNFSQMNSLFSSQTSINQLGSYVNNYNTGNNTILAMTDADFNTLHQAIQRQFFPNERMNSLSDAFNNSSHYFTSSQAKQLIQLIAFESNRLQLAKLSYRTITDRTNFDQLYDLLSSQASKNELDAYVKAYKVSTEISVN